MDAVANPSCGLRRPSRFGRGLKQIDKGDKKRKEEEGRFGKGTKRSIFQTLSNRAG